MGIWFNKPYPAYKKFYFCFLPYSTRKVKSEISSLAQQWTMTFFALLMMQPLPFSCQRTSRDTHNARVCSSHPHKQRTTSHPVQRHIAWVCEQDKRNTFLLSRWCSGVRVYIWSVSMPDDERSWCLSQQQFLSRYTVLIQQDVCSYSCPVYFFNTLLQEANV